MSEEEEITRCVCGELEPADESGLYIQCEQCSVWQHGFCVGIVEDVPDKYWCEQCKPELHDLYTDDEGRKRSHYLPVQEETVDKDTDVNENEEEDTTIKEENIVNKQESTTQDEEKDENKKNIITDNKTSDHNEEETRSSHENDEDNNDEEDDEDHDDDEEGDFHELSKRASRSSREEQQYQRMLEQAIKESQMDAPGDKTKTATPVISATEDIIATESEKPELKTTTSVSESLDENIETTEQDSQTDATEAESNRLNRTDDNDEDNKSTSSKDKQKAIKKPNRVAKKPRRTKSKRNLTDGRRTNSNNKNKEKSVDVTATNSVKPRLPSQRTTMNEMRRRTSAILEFISRTQWDLENVQKERADLIRFVENDQFVEKIDHIFTQNNEALTMMNELTQNLLNWEKNYSNEN